MNATAEVKQLLINELFTLLITRSNGKLTGDEAQKIATRVIDNLDFENQAVMHKGLTWIAGEILKSMKIDN